MIAAEMRRHLFLFVFVVLWMGIGVAPAAAQDLFEIQVYPYETVEPHRTMVELHTNFFPARFLRSADHRSLQCPRPLEKGPSAQGRALSPSAFCC